MVRCFILILLATGLCRATEPKPILVVLEQNPWLSVIGSDSPVFTLYEDGTIYYLRIKPTDDAPFHSRVVSDANAKLRELLGFDPGKIEERYDLSAASDQRTTVIWTRTKRIEIYGNWRKFRDPDYEALSDSDPRLKRMVERERNMWKSLPPEIRAALNRIDQIRSQEGQRWFPAKIEIMLWPYEYAPEASIAWPKDWPALAAKDTRKRGDSFSVFLPSEKLPDLRQFLATRNERGAVLIDGKKMAVAIRFPFPGEEEWMR